VPAWIEQSLGVALVLFILLDVFMTVLYARLDSGVPSYQVARVVWLENYVQLRERWQPHIDHLGRAGAFDPQEIDPIESDPEATDPRPEFQRRLHTMG
jgi:hypothetical protein